MGVNILQIFHTDLCEVIEKEFEFQLQKLSCKYMKITI